MGVERKLEWQQAQEDSEYNDETAEEKSARLAAEAIKRTKEKPSAPPEIDLPKPAQQDLFPHHYRE